MEITMNNNLKSRIKKITNRIFNQPIYLFIFLFCADLAIGFILLWQLVLFPFVDNKPQSLLVLNKNSLDKFVEDWAKQEEKFQAIKNENYPDIFSGFSTTIIITATTTENQ